MEKQHFQPEADSINKQLEIESNDNEPNLRNYFCTQYSLLDFYEIKYQSIQQSLSKYFQQYEINNQIIKNIQLPQYNSETAVNIKDKVKKENSETQIFQKCKYPKNSIEQNKYFIQNYKSLVNQIIWNVYTTFSQFLYNNLKLNYLKTLKFQIDYHKKYYNYGKFLNFENQEMIKNSEQQYLRNKKQYISNEIDKINIILQKQKNYIPLSFQLKKRRKFFLLQLQRLKLYPKISLFYFHLKIQWEKIGIQQNQQILFKKYQFSKLKNLKQISQQKEIQMMVKAGINNQLSLEAFKISYLLSQKCRQSFIEKNLLNYSDSKICLCLNICKIQKRITQQLQYYKRNYRLTFEKDIIFNEIQKGIFQAFYQKQKPKNIQITQFTADLNEMENTYYIYYLKKQRTIINLF